MTVPPMDGVGSQLWMAVDDVFHIKGRGTVLTGQLEGYGQLHVGDAMLCDDGQRWVVGGIEQFRKQVPAADPGASIGVLLRAAPALGMLRGSRVWFEPGDSDARKKRRWRG
jgi:elongation factor Tu